MFVVVERLPETNPDIEQAQAAAQPPDKTVGNECPQAGPAQEQSVVRPFRPPGQDEQQHAHGRTKKHQDQDSYTMQP